MSRQHAQTPLLFALLALFTAPAWLNAGQKEPGPVPGEDTSRDALVRFDKEWKDYTNEPNYGDPRWKLKMETLVGLAKAGPAAFPFLEAAGKDGSPWSPHSRQLATEVLKTWRERPAVRDAWASYDLSQMDIAKEGKLAPDFDLADAAGQIYRLSEYRGKKTVVLTFILQDI
jgi:hypothetical protein